MNNNKVRQKKIAAEPSIVSGMKVACFSKYADPLWHVHETAFFGCVESGILNVRTARQSIALSSGMTVYIPPGVPHYEKCVGTSVSGWFLNLPSERSPFPLDDVLVLNVTPLLACLCDRIASWGAITDVEKSTAQKRLVLTFLDELSVSQRSENLIISFPQTSSLCQVAQKVMEMPDNMDGIDHWAKISGMSRRSFTECFRKETGLSFALWRQRVKLQASLKALALGKTVTQVAHELGYQNASTFIAIFRNQFGVSPAQYVRSKGFRNGS